MPITSVIYIKVVGKKAKCTWYVPVSKDPTKNLHISYKTDKSGYGGALIKFRLVDGTVDVVKGPYCCEEFGVDFFIEDVGYTPLRIVEMYVDGLMLEDS